VILCGRTAIVVTVGPSASRGPHGWRRLILPPAAGNQSIGMERGTQWFLGALWPVDGDSREPVRLGVKSHAMRPGYLGPNPTADLVGVEVSCHGS